MYELFFAPRDVERITQPWVRKQGMFSISTFQSSVVFLKHRLKLDCSYLHCFIYLSIFLKIKVCILGLFQIHMQLQEILQRYHVSFAHFPPMVMSCKNWCNNATRILTSTQSTNLVCVCVCVCMSVCVCIQLYKILSHTYVCIFRTPVKVQNYYITKNNPYSLLYKLVISETLIQLKVKSM